MKELALDIQNLGKTYPNGFCALKGINLQVKKGSFFGLLGYNGAGKSTTLGTVSGLVRKTSGSIKVFGYDIDTHLLDSKLQVGVMPQEVNFNFFETCVNALLLQGGLFGLSTKQAKVRAQYLLERMMLWDKRNDKIMSLSGGMKRRLMIARALMHEPKLLLLDEPTAGVDVEIRKTIWEFVQEINKKGTTIILTTHYLEEVEQFCEEIAILQKGSMAVQDKTSNLLKELATRTLILELRKPLDAVPEITLKGLISLKKLDSNTLQAVLSESVPLNSLLESLASFGVIVFDTHHEQNRIEALFLSKLKKENETNSA